MKFDLKTPCANCPFRSDRVFYLGRNRVWEIVLSVARQDQLFPCHKTTTFDGDDEEPTRIEIEREQQCAGASIMLEHEGQPNAMLQIAGRFGLYNPARLNMAAPVYKSAQAMIDAVCEAENQTPPKLPKHGLGMQISPLAYPMTPGVRGVKPYKTET